MNYLRFLLFFALLGCLACGNKPAESESATTTSVAAAPVGEATYPSIPLERLEYLWDNSSHMDVMFYELPVSLNQDNQEGVRSTLSYVAEDAPLIDPNCRSIGRLFFTVGTENTETAEIYFNTTCAYFVWLENEKPAYANQMTEGGIQFFNNLFAGLQQGGQ